MQTLFGIKHPCETCSECKNGLCMTNRAVDACVRWRVWFKAVWPKTIKYLNAQVANGATHREYWVYYHPDEIEAMRRHEHERHGNQQAEQGAE